MTTPVTSSSTTPRTTGSALAMSGAQTKDMFLKLLVAQMKNQDPSNVQKPEDMASQLAQFSSLEQLVSIKDAISAQGSGSDALQQTLVGMAAIGAVGKTGVFHNEGGEVVTGRIDAVLSTPDGMAVRIGDRVIPFANLVEVRA